jgi:uncharacterized protein YjiS (DUF1127 family)
MQLNRATSYTPEALCQAVADWRRYVRTILSMSSIAYAPSPCFRS